MAVNDLSILEKRIEDEVQIFISIPHFKYPIEKKDYLKEKDDKNKEDKVKKEIDLAYETWKIENGDQWKKSYSRIGKFLLDYAKKVYRHKYKNELEKYEKEIPFPYCIQLIQTMISCLQTYNPEKDVEGKPARFINYFNYSFSLAIKVDKAVEKEERLHGGIHLPDKKIKELLRIIKAANELGKDLTDPKALETLAKMKNVPVEKIKELIEYNNRTVQSNIVQNDEGEEVNLFDEIGSTEDSNIRFEFINENLDKIEAAKDEFSQWDKAVLTHYLIEKIPVQSKEELYDILKGRKFFLEKEFYKNMHLTREEKRIDVTLQNDVDYYTVNKQTQELGPRSVGSYSNTLKRILAKINK